MRFYYLDMNLDWFNDNYLENSEQIDYLLDKIEKYHAITREQLLDGCKELRKISTDKELLETHIRLFTNMSDVGINAHIAGVKLREALLDTQAYNCA